MEDRVFTDVDIQYVRESFQKQGISKTITDIAIEDVKNGTPKEKVMIYASAGGNVESVRKMSKAIKHGASERLVQRIGHLDKDKADLAFRELEYGTPEDMIMSVISRKVTAHDMDQTFKRYRDNMANTEPIEQSPDRKNDTGEKDVSESTEGKAADTGNKNQPADTKVYISSEEIAEALGPVMKQMTEQLMNQFEKTIEPMVAAIQKPNAESNEESKNPRMVFVDMDQTKAEIPAAEEKREPVPESESGSSNVINGDFHMVLTTPDGKSIPVHVDQAKPKKPKNVISIAERFFKGTPSQKSLLRMLIEGRLTAEQLKQVKRAKELKFTDKELKDLIESGLPADEMSGIIDVVMSDKRVAV